MKRLTKISATIVFGAGFLLGNDRCQNVASAQETVRPNQERVLVVPVLESAAPLSESADSVLPNARPRSEIEQWEKAWQVKPLSDRAAISVEYSSLTFVKQPSQAELLTNQRSPQSHDVFWHASGLYSQPTYFDDVDLENYGHVHCLQPVKSGVRFCADVVLLPWEVCFKHPTIRVYSFGLERPGNLTRSVREKRH